MENNFEKLINLHGPVDEFKTPSGQTVYLREINGEDENIISNKGLSKEGKSFNLYITRVVVGFNEQIRNPTYAEVMSWGLRDKYAILIRSRIISIGSILEFRFHWPNDKQATTYSEDLTNFIWDYNQPMPTEEDKLLYNEERIPPYGPEFKSGYRTHTLTNGKQVRYKFSTGYTEKFMMDLVDEDTHRNSELFARELSLLVDKDWIKVENLSQFSSKDLREIRADIEKVDKNYNLLTEVVNPRNPFEKQFIPVVGIEDFFFPKEI